jgi:hypothetical protein
LLKETENLSENIAATFFRWKLCTWDEPSNFWSPKTARVTRLPFQTGFQTITRQFLWCHDFQHNDTVPDDSSSTATINITYFTLTLSVIILFILYRMRCVFTLRLVKIFVVMQCVVLVSIINLSVIIQSVNMPSVVVPFQTVIQRTLSSFCGVGYKNCFGNLYFATNKLARLKTSYEEKGVSKLIKNCS